MTRTDWVVFAGGFVVFFVLYAWIGAVITT